MRCARYCCWHMCLSARCNAFHKYLLSFMKISSFDSRKTRGARGEPAASPSKHKPLHS